MYTKVNFDQMRASFNSGQPTVADFKALIGNDIPTVRVNGAGIRGLRWTVVGVDEKKGTVSLSAKNAAGQTMEHTDSPSGLTISAVRRKGALKGI